MRGFLASAKIVLNVKFACGALRQRFCTSIAPLSNECSSPSSITCNHGEKKELFADRDFAAEVVELLSPSREQVEQKASLEKTLHEVVSRLGGYMATYGSCENGTWMQGSDIDLTWIFKRPAKTPSTDRYWQAAQLRKLRAELGSVNVQEIVSTTVIVARVPVLKLHGADGEVVCDITMNNFEGLHNTRLVRGLCNECPTLAVLVRLLKHWAQQKGIADRSQGGFSTYTFVIMAAHFLQSAAAQNYLSADDIRKACLEVVRLEKDFAADNISLFVGPGVKEVHAFDTEGSLPGLSELLVDFFTFFSPYVSGGRVVLDGGIDPSLVSAIKLSRTRAVRGEVSSVSSPPPPPLLPPPPPPPPSPRHVLGNEARVESRPLRVPPPPTSSLSPALNSRSPAVSRPSPPVSPASLPSPPPLTPHPAPPAPLIGAQQAKTSPSSSSAPGNAPAAMQVAPERPTTLATLAAPPPPPPAKPAPLASSSSAPTAALLNPVPATIPAPLSPLKASSQLAAAQVESTSSETDPPPHPLQSSLPPPPLCQTPVQTLSQSPASLALLLPPPPLPSPQLPPAQSPATLQAAPTRLQVFCPLTGLEVQRCSVGEWRRLSRALSEAAELLRDSNISLQARVKRLFQHVVPPPPPPPPSMPPPPVPKADGTLLEVSSV